MKQRRHNETIGETVKILRNFFCLRDLFRLVINFQEEQQFRATEKAQWAKNERYETFKKKINVVRKKKKVTKKEITAV